MSSQTIFNDSAFQDALTTEAMGRHFVYRLRTETTMVLARREADEGAPHGTLVLAEEQTAGRGRRGRSFYSPPGENLYFTLVLRLGLETHRRLPVAVPLAVCAACAGEGVEARIKWPNDIWVDDRKLSGILIDADLVGAEAISFPGIGVNVNGDPTLNPELRDIATSLRRELGLPVERERLLARICNQLEAALAMPEPELVSRYRDLSIVLGRRVVVSPAGQTLFEAVAEAIAEDGSLVVRRDNGAVETIRAAEVTVRPA